MKEAKNHELERRIKKLEENKASFISVTITAEQTLTENGGAQKINLNKVINQEQNDLTLTSGDVICNKAGNIEISAMFQMTNLAAGANNVLVINKNSTSICSIAMRPANTATLSYSSPIIIEDVSIGDKISFLAGNWSASTPKIVPGNNATRLTIKYI